MKLKASYRMIWGFFFIWILLVIFISNKLIFKFHFYFFVVKYLRVNISKNFSLWNLGTIPKKPETQRNLGGVSGPFFSDSSCKVRVWAAILDHLNHFWPKFLIFSKKKCQTARIYHRNVLFNKSSVFNGSSWNFYYQ